MSFLFLSWTDLYLKVSALHTAQDRVAIVVTCYKLFLSVLGRPLVKVRYFVMFGLHSPTKSKSILLWFIVCLCDMLYLYVSSFALRRVVKLCCFIVLMYLNVFCCVFCRSKVLFAIVTLAVVFWLFNLSTQVCNPTHEERHTWLWTHGVLPLPSAIGLRIPLGLWMSVPGSCTHQRNRSC